MVSGICSKLEPARVSASTDRRRRRVSAFWFDLPDRTALSALGEGHRRSRVRFEGTSNYVATDDLKVAVNAAVTLRRPLLVKGEPGTGKTVLAHEIAAAADAPLIQWHIK